ncbi:SPFH domain-containing protein [Nocardia sp. NPDC057030]|uniref:SPFH domain-containing protein n=1 Tax=unclassified Nocardia TaxID=2637762 RepID=UPI00363F34D9
MPWFFLFFVIFGIIAALASLAARAKDEDVRIAARGATVLCAAVALLALALSSFTIVSTRNVGVLTSFGRPVGTLSNGIHPKVPWQKKHELNGTIQTNWKRGGFDASGTCDGGTTVRLANNSTACVDNSVRWRINPAAADALYRDYQNDENIRASLVTRALEASLNDTFASYNPLAPEAAGGPNLADMAATATGTLRARTAGQIEVLEIIISILYFDAPTQAAINRFQTQAQETRIAVARQETASAEAEVNRRLADSIRADPNVLVARCLDMANAGKQIGLSCWPLGGLPVAIAGR